MSSGGSDRRSGGSDRRSGGDAVGVGSIYCLLPDERVKIEDLAEFELLDHDAAQFALASGVQTVGVAEQTTVALAAEAVRGLHEQQPAEPDVLLLVSARSPDVLLGSDAAHLQAAAGFRGAFALGIDGLGCTGSSAAWALARDLLVADPARRQVLIAHASRPTGLSRVRYPVTVIGDGAFAMTMVRGGRPTLRAHRMEMDGAFHDLFHVDYKRAPSYEWQEECRSPDRYRFELAMHSRLRLGRMVDEVLHEAGLRKDDVATTLVQNVTAGAFAFYEGLLGLAIHPVCRAHLAAWGHLGAMDVVLNLDRLLAEGGLRAGDPVLVLNNSPVAAWAVTLWEV